MPNERFIGVLVLIFVGMLWWGTSQATHRGVYVYHLKPLLCVSLVCWLVGSVLSGLSLIVWGETAKWLAWLSFASLGLLILEEIFLIKAIERSQWTALGAWVASIGFFGTAGLNVFLMFGKLE